MGEVCKAIFLSYASQDADAAKRICEALHTAGVEVWFDVEGGLEHGDEWDAKIRRQIRECVLFVPLISASTQTRHEGYFRIEWDLAAERAQAIAAGVPFILPVIVDDTREPDALVPDRFRKVQWTRLALRAEQGAGGKEQALHGFAARLQKIYQQRLNPSVMVPPISLSAAPVSVAARRSRAPKFVFAAVAVLLLGAGGWYFAGRSPAAPQGVVAAPKQPEGPISEAKKLARQAMVILNRAEDGYRESAEVLTERALALDKTDAEVWAAASSVNTSFINNVSGRSPERVRNAQEWARRALSLDPNLFEARSAWAAFLIKDPAVRDNQTDRIPSAREAEPILQKLRQERPGDPRALRLLGEALLVLGRIDEAKEMFADLDAVRGRAGSGAWEYLQSGYLKEADATVDKSITVNPGGSEIALKVYLAAMWHGNLDMAAAALMRVPENQRRGDYGVAVATFVHVWRREPAKLLALLQQVPRDWIAWGINGPRDALMGDAQARLGRMEAARLNWQQALKLVNARLAGTPGDSNLLGWKVYLLDALGDTVELAQTRRLLAEVPSLTDAGLQYDLRSRTQSDDGILDQLESLYQINPKHLTLAPAALRLNPTYDRLRDTPRFKALFTLVEANAKANGMVPTGK